MEQRCIRFGLQRLCLRAEWLELELLRWLHGFQWGAGPGIFGASSSRGLTGGVGGLAVNPSAPGAVTAGGLSFGSGLLSGFAGEVTATNYSNPIQIGKFWVFDVGDWAMYAAKQVCQAASF